MFLELRFMHETLQDTRATVKHIHVYTEKNNVKEVQSNKKTCKELLLYVWYFMLFFILFNIYIMLTTSCVLHLE